MKSRCILLDFYNCWNGKNIATDVSRTLFSALLFLPKFSVWVLIILCVEDDQKEQLTQVLTLHDMPKDANLILISFRGTETFEADHWLLNTGTYAGQKLEQ